MADAREGVHAKGVEDAAERARCERLQSVAQRGFEVWFGIVAALCFGVCFGCEELDGIEDRWCDAMR